VLWSEPESASRRERLEKLAGDVDPRAWPPASLSLLGRALSEAGARDAAVALLQRAQSAHPGDVWVNYDLARAHEEVHHSRGEGAITFFTAARALRPETAHELGHALEARGRDAEARVIFEDLTRLRSTNGGHWHCLGQVLQRGGDLAGSQTAFERAVQALRVSIRSDPGDFLSHYILGSALEGRGKVGMAIAQYRAALRLQPDSANVHDSLGALLLARWEMVEAMAEFRESSRLARTFSAPHHNLGLALRSQGKIGDAIAEFREAIRLDGELVGEAPFELGATLRGLGRYGEAIDLYRSLREKVRDNPRLHARVVADLSVAERQAAQVAQLPSVLRGDVKPKSAAEGLDFALLAYHARQYGLSARLYAESFRVDGRLAWDMQAEYRYTAARAAALAAADKGSAEPALDEPGKAKLRLQALDWLRAEFSCVTTLFQTGLPMAMEPINMKLRRWKYDPELASIRDEDALNGLPETERRAWRGFWATVDALLDQTQVGG
jgi:serine/threonine-protein kinase